MQLNEHQNGAVPVPRPRPGPPEQPQTHTRSPNTDIDWLKSSWKSFLMILIATIILSLPILSKAHFTTDNFSSCAFSCLETVGLEAGCTQDDIACICRAGLGLGSTAQEEVHECMNQCETFDSDEYMEYASTICRPAAARDVKGYGTTVSDTRIPMTITLTGDGQVATNVPKGFVPVYVSTSPGSASAAGVTTPPSSTSSNRWGQQLKPTSFPNVPDSAFIPPSRTPNQDDGLSLGAKIAIGVVIPLAVIAGLFFLWNYLKKRKAANKSFVSGSSDQDEESGAAGGIGGNKAELPAGVMMTKEEKKAAEKEAKEQAKAEKNGTFGHMFGNPQELEAQAMEKAQAVQRAVEMEQETGVVAPTSHNYNYAPLPSGVAELYSPGAHPLGHNVEMDGQSPRDIHELHSAPSSPPGISPAPTYTTVAPSSPQNTIAHALGGTSPREGSMQRALSSKDSRPTQGSPLAGPVPSAMDLYPPTASSDNAAIVEEERRLAAKRAAIAERKELAEEEEQLEREEEALRMKKASKGGN